MAAEPQDRHGRRAMFRVSLSRLVDPLADFLQQRLPQVEEDQRFWLRPPGALVEAEFLVACQRCGKCVEVCPANAIHPLNIDEPQLRGTPFIDPDLSACTICDELLCMRHCPSGALRLVASPNEIRMGVARVHAEHCLRTSAQPCSLCVDKCPVGDQAIWIAEGGQIEVRDGCVGCGMCQFYCPVRPKAIRVEPGTKGARP